MTVAFGLIEVAVKQILERDLVGAAGKIGGDLSYDGSSDFYVWLGLVPGGSSDQIAGDFVMDIDVFAGDYRSAMSKALAIEALLVGRHHRSDEMRIDRCLENIGPAERPWDDDNVFRVGATYVFTARRTG